MRLFLIWFCFILFFSEGHSQGTENSPPSNPFYTRQIELRHENDFLIYTDRYYTSGSYIEYRKLAEKNLSENRKEQLTVRLEHLLYTPTNILSEDLNDYDRPYAGYLGISGESFITFKHQAARFRFAVGVTGPMSLAENFQYLFHNTGGISTPPWESQIKNNFHFNFYGGYLFEWELLPNPFSVHVALSPEVAFGTRDVYIDHGVKFFFGQRNTLSKTMAYQQLGAVEKEFFFSFNFTYRNVIHNALLEGHLIEDDSPLLIESKREAYFYGLEGYYRTLRNDFKIGCQYSTRETASTVFHMFVTLSVARRF